MGKRRGQVQGEPDEKELERADVNEQEDPVGAHSDDYVENDGDTRELPEVSRRQVHAPRRTVVGSSCQK